MPPSLSELALNGASPTVYRDQPHFVWPVVDGQTERAVIRQLHESVSIYNRSGVIARLEDRLSSVTGTRHAVLTNSGTSALHTAYVAAQLGRGDEVIVPAYTFFATATPLFFTGACPVFADAGPDGNVNVSDVVHRITSKTRAIVVTHMWGIPADIGALRRIADEHDLLLIEDTSHAFGASVSGRPVGSFGHASAQSLQGQKPLTGGEGGAFFTDDDELFYRALSVGHYNKRCKVEIPADHSLAEFAITGFGLKFRIHPLAAAIAEEQLDRWPDIAAGRERTAKRLAAELAELPGLTPLLPSDGDVSSWYALILKIDSTALGGVTVPDLHRALLAEGAAEVDRPGSTCPLPGMPLFQRPQEVFPAYDGYVAPSAESFQGAQRFHTTILKLPVWHDPADDALVDQYVAAFEKVTTVAAVHGKVTQ